MSTTFARFTCSTTIFIDTTFIDSTGPVPSLLAKDAGHQIMSDGVIAGLEPIRSETDSAEGEAHLALRRLEGH